MNHPTRVLTAFLGASLMLTSCGSSGDGSPKVRVSAADRQEATTLFNTVCASCHGTTGHGDGPAAAALEPKPRSYSDKQWQASVKDDDIRKVITLGGAAVGKSANMPPQPQLKSRPGVVQALVEIVRSYGR